METVRLCGCKGIRTCLICELEFNISKPKLVDELKNKKSYTYCPFCNKAYPGWNLDWENEHPNHQKKSIEFPGVYIMPNFLNTEESISLMQDLDELPWDLSQSGRRKQNYGPKCNFKKRKLQIGSFNGFPYKTKFIQDRFKSIPLLNNFQTIEQCSLEYTPEKGASIDPHIDDCWIWGERIVTVNVIGDSVLTMTSYQGPNSRYNLDFHKQLSCNNDNEVEDCTDKSNIVIRLPMPARSLMLLYGPARYKWEHCVLREDISDRRVCLAYREFTEPYLPNGICNGESEQIFINANKFW